MCSKRYLGMLIGPEGRNAMCMKGDSLTRYPYKSDRQRNRGKRGPSIGT